MPGRYRSQDPPVPPATTSAITTTTLTPAVTTFVASTTTTTSPACNTLPAPEDDHPTPPTEEGRESRQVCTVVRQQVRDSRAGRRARGSQSQQVTGTEALDNIARVLGAYERAQGQTGQAQEDSCELRLLLRSINTRMGQIVDLLSQLVAFLRDKPGAQTTPPPPSGGLQDDSSTSSLAATEREDSSDSTGPAAEAPPAKRPRGHSKKSKEGSRGKAPAKLQSRSEP